MLGAAARSGFSDRRDGPEMPLQQRRWLVCKCWRAISTAETTQARRRKNTDYLLARLKDEMDLDPALHRRRPLSVYRRYLRRGQQYLTAEPSRFTGAVDKVSTEPLHSTPIFFCS